MYVRQHMMDREASDITLNFNKNYFKDKSLSKTLLGDKHKIFFYTLLVYWDWKWKPSSIFKIMNNFIITKRLSLINEFIFDH